VLVEGSHARTTAAADGARRLDEGVDRLFLRDGASERVPARPRSLRGRVMGGCRLFYMSQY
jgi:hypothetical protein